MVIVLVYQHRKFLIYGLAATINAFYVIAIAYFLHDKNISFHTTCSN